MLPQDICNRAIGVLGVDTVIGAFTDGTTVSEECRRIYGPTLRQLLRAANWSWARKLAPLQLLGDATGQTLDPSGVPYSTAVEIPWIYAYAWPSDGLRARWMPQQQVSPLTGVPLMTGLQTTPGPGARLYPARFLVSSSEQFPMVIGQTDWDSLPDLNSTEGVGQIGRRIVLTNVQNATLVYTKLTLQIEEWDELFAAAMVATLASLLAMKLIPDKKLAMAERNAQVGIAQAIVREARTVNANDAGFPQSVSRDASWIRARSAGMSRWGGSPFFDGAAGYTQLGWEACGWADGSVY